LFPKHIFRAARETCFYGAHILVYITYANIKDIRLTKMFVSWPRTCATRKQTLMRLKHFTFVAITTIVTIVVHRP